MRVDIKNLVAPLMNVLDNCLAILQLEERQAVHNTDKGIAGAQAPEFQAIAFFIDVNPQLAAFRMRDADQFNFIRNIPALSEQAAGA
ncbi:hypothetical protein D3C76_706160 [compost metagenome]